MKMKLFFKKTEDRDIVQLQNNTSNVPFSYLLMLKQLMENNVIEEPEFEGYEEVEKTRIMELLDGIHNAVEEVMNTDLDN